MIGNLFRTLAGGERRATFSKPSAGWDGVDMLAGARSSTGVSVTPQSSLSNTTVLACVSLIARTLASVPLTLYQRDGRVRNPAPDHAAYELLRFGAEAEVLAPEALRDHIGRIASNLAQRYATTQETLADVERISAAAQSTVDCCAAPLS